MTDRRNDHYLQLISNASLLAYPDNVTSEFTTQLANPLYLDGKWEVALLSSSYHKNWVNIADSSECTVRLTIEKLRTVEIDDAQRNIVPATRISQETIVQEVFVLPYPGNYSTPETVIDILLKLDFIYQYGESQHVIPLKDLMTFHFNTATQKFTAKFKEHALLNHQRITLKFSGLLSYYMGLVNDSDTAGILKLTNPIFQSPHLPPEDLETTKFFPYPIRLKDMFNMFLYSEDLVQASPLADTDAEYLHVIPVGGEEGHYVHYEVRNPIYKTVKAAVIRSIHLKVANDRGERVKFNIGSGEFTVLLHLKRVR